MTSSETLGSQRQRFVFGTETYSAKPPATIDADPLRVRAKMPPSSQAVPAMAAHDMSFGRDNFARLEIADGTADLIDYANEFVSDHHRNRNRLLCPRVPVIYMHVGAADRSLLNADENVVWPYLGDWNLFQIEPRFGPAFDERLHRLAHGVENR